MTRAIPVLSLPGVKNLAAEVWSYVDRTLTQAAASVQAAVTGASITVYRGTTWSISLTGLGDLTAFDKIYCSVKRNAGQADSEAVLRLSDTDGLEWFNQVAAATPGDGSLVVTDAVIGAITLTVEAAVTQNAPLGTFLYDIKGVATDGNPVTLKSIGGQFVIAAEVTRAVT